MAFKLIALVSFVAAASAGIIPLEHHELEHHHQPQLYHAQAPQQHVIYQKQPVAHEVYPNDPHPKYNFAYDVKDAVSGDVKSQIESRDGDVVQGEYSLDDADGFRRTVKYTADDVNGFNAVVHREPLTHVHKVIATAPAPVQYHHAAPTTFVKAPVATYAAPAYSAPAYAAPAYSAPAYSAPAHHEQQHHEHAASYATYEAPAAQESHDYYHH